MRRLGILICLLPFLLGAAPSRTHTYTSGNTIEPTEVTTNEDNIYAYLQAGVDTYKDDSVTTDALQNASVTNAKLAADAVTSATILDGTIAAADVAAGLGSPVWKATTTNVLTLASSGDVAFTDDDWTTATSSTATVAIVNMGINNTTANEFITVQLRKNGETPAVPANCRAGGESGASDNTLYCTMIVGMDAGQVIEYFVDVESASTGTITADIIGYWE